MSFSLLRSYHAPNQLSSFSYKSAPVLSTDATSNLDAVLADESAKVIFIDSQVSANNNISPTR